MMPGLTATTIVSLLIAPGGVAAASQSARPSDLALRAFVALRRAADSLDIAQSLRRQPDVIERCFAHAAAILQRVDDRQSRPPGV